MKPGFNASLVIGVAGALLLSAPLETLAQDPALEEIIVSARKKEENIQEVPVAVTAISAAMLERMNLQSLDDISKVTAGLLFDPEFDRTSNRPVIRGQANILNDSGVSYFIDGVYITGSINDYDINDVERIEVVKGPQSALYGRNTYSGAINIITKAPSDEFSADLKVSYSDDEQTEISASVKGPISDTFSAGITYRSFQLDDAWENAFDGNAIGVQDSESFSGVAVWQPNDQFTARARVYYNETRDGQPALFRQPHSENNCFFDNGSFYGGGGRYYCGTLEPRDVESDWTIQAPDAANDLDTLQTSLVLDYDFNDNVTLTSITGFNDVDELFITEADYGPDAFQANVFARFPIGGFPDPSGPFVPPFFYGFAASIADFTFANDDQTEDWSQEVRLTARTERGVFMIGVYHFEQENTSRPARVLPAGADMIAMDNWNALVANEQTICGFNPVCGGVFFPFTLYPGISVPSGTTVNDIRNSALFGLAAFDLTDATRLTLEARWAEERVETWSSISAKATYTSVNPRITLDHQLDDDHMVYALLAAGNKPGGFNNATAISVGLPTFDEEEVRSFEIGSKNVLADGQVTANLAMFFNQVTGYQLTQNARTLTNTTSATVNAGDADIFGVEVEIQARPEAVEGLALTFNYAYTDAEFVSGTDENEGLLIDVADDGLVNCSQGDQFPEESGCTSLFGSIEGRKIPRTAEHQLFFDVEMTRPLGTAEGWDWYAGFNYSYESSKYAQVLNLAETGDTSLVNARFGVRNDNWTISLWGKNITGEDSSPLLLRYADASDAFKRNFVGMQRRDTHWGLTVSADF